VRVHVNVRVRVCVRVCVCVCMHVRVCACVCFSLAVLCVSAVVLLSYVVSYIVSVRSPVLVGSTLRYNTERKTNVMFRKLDISHDGLVSQVPLLL